LFLKEVGSGSYYEHNVRHLLQDSLFSIGFILLGTQFSVIRVSGFGGEGLSKGSSYGVPAFIGVHVLFV
jgi:hypothetical protein